MLVGEGALLLDAAGLGEAGPVVGLGVELRLAAVLGVESLPTVGTAIGPLSDLSVKETFGEAEAVKMILEGSRQNG